MIESDSVSLVDFRPTSFKVMSLATNVSEKEPVLQRLALQAGVPESFPVLSLRKNDVSVVTRREDFADLLSVDES